MAIKIKTPDQIEGIRRSCQLARKTIKHIVQFIQPGVTTKFIDQKVEEFIRDHGAIPATLNYKGYPASSCISVNDVVCHGVPSDKVILRQGDIVNVDVTTILNGYYGDTCMMYPVGPISETSANLLKVARECLDAGISVCRPGNYIGDIGAAITRHAERNGYSVVYQFCGHGVGVEFHEEPEVAHDGEAGTGPKMVPGMTFTIEPMINQGKARVKIDKSDKWTARTIDGRWSAQYEHTVLITPTGVDVLTDIDNEYAHLKNQVAITA
jgi:methionyl aminopeptidase